MIGIISEPIHQLPTYLHSIFYLLLLCDETDSIIAHSDTQKEPFKHNCLEINIEISYLS